MARKKRRRRGEADGQADRPRESKSGSTSAPNALDAGPEPTASASDRRGRLLNLAMHAVVPVAFAVLIWTTIPVTSFFEVDPDEGNNVIKALLLAEGHPLYTETWSDQAPLFTYALQWWFDLFGATALAARVLVLVCASILLWAVYQTLRITWGHPHAIAGAVLVILIPYFAALSVSIMLGLPALMWATIAVLGVTLWHKDGRVLWLVLSAVALSLSVLTKLFTGFLVPVFVAGILVHAWLRGRGQPRPVKRLIPAAVWCGIFVVVAAGIGLVIVTPAGVSQLVEPHTAARTIYGEANPDQTIGWRLTGEGKPQGCVDILVLALVGTALAALRRDGSAWYPAGWALLAYVLLRSHAPIWYHHVPLVMIPCALLGGIAVGEMIPKSRQLLGLPRTPVDIARTLLRVVAFVATVMVIAFLPGKLAKSYEFGSMIRFAPRDRYLTAVMKQYADQSEWVFADRQMYAFEANLPVPPALSVTSRKRILTTDLGDEELVAIIDEYKPEQIVFCGWRMPMGRPMAVYLQENYTKIYRDEVSNAGGRTGIHIRKGLDGDFPAALTNALDEAPDCPQAYDNLGRWAGQRGDTEAAIRYYREALEIDPDYDRATIHLADTLLAEQRYEEGLRVYQDALQRADGRKRLMPGLSAQAAWRLATCPEPRVRNGLRAEQLAAAAVKASPRTARYHFALAAACAEQSRFQDAVRYAEQAFSLAAKAGQRRLALRIQAAMERFQANRSYQETVTVPGFGA